MTSAGDTSASQSEKMCVGAVLRRAGLAGADWNEPAAVTALFMAAQKYFPGSVHSDTDTDDDYAAAAASESERVCVDDDEEVGWS